MSKDAWHRFSDKCYCPYQVVERGFKYNMMDRQPTIGIHQLARVDANWRRRRERWERYDEAIAGLPAGLTAVPETHTRHGHHLYTLMIDEECCGRERDEFLEAMNVARIGTGAHYLSLPEPPFYRERFGWRPERWPHAMRIGR